MGAGPAPREPALASSLPIRPTAGGCAGPAAMLGPEMALAESGPSTALPTPSQDNFESRCLQDFHGRDSDVGLVIAHKGIVPKNDRAPRSARGHGTARKPTMNRCSA